MLKKSKVVALLVVFVMMFAVVEPALAWWGEDTAYGAVKTGATFGFWGAVAGAAITGVAVGAVILTGGLAGLTFAGVATGVGMGAGYGALLGGSTGGTGGAIVGAAIGLDGGKEAVDKVLDDMAQNPSEIAKEVAKVLIIGVVTGQITK